MVVVAFVRSPERHDHKVLALVETKIVYGGFQQMRIFAEPLGKVDGRENRHGDDRRWSRRRSKGC